VVSVVVHPSWESHSPTPLACPPCRSITVRPEICRTLEKCNNPVKALEPARSKPRDRLLVHRCLRRFRVGWWRFPSPPKPAG
jgi:hypothetical protein